MAITHTNRSMIEAIKQRSKHKGQQHRDEQTEDIDWLVRRIEHLEDAILRHVVYGTAREMS